jgi:hypothetical protein
MTITEQQAAGYLKFVDYAYTMFGEDGTNLVPLPPPDFPENYKILVYLNAVDPVDEVRVFFGFLAYATDGSAPAVLAIRGTYDLVEWLNDADVLPEPFEPIPGSYIAAGFDDLYATIGWRTLDTSAFDPVAAIKSQAQGVVVAGHSLGGALGTLMIASWVSALPILNAGLSICTAASPAVGDETFASGFNTLVANSSRYINELDGVASVLDPIYTQVNGDGIPLGPSWDIIPTPGCEHSLDSYLWLMDPGSYSLPSDCSWADAVRRERLKTVVQARAPRRRTRPASVPPGPPT